MTTSTINPNTLWHRALGIQTLTNVISAQASSSRYVNFVENLQVEEFSGRFMLHAESTNIEYVTFFLKDVNGNILTEEGTNDHYLITDKVYDFSAKVKYISIFGRALEQGQCGTQFFKVTGAHLDSLTAIGTTFTDGSIYANVLVRELYIPSDIIGSGNPKLAIFQVRNNQHVDGELLTIVDMDSYNSDINLFASYFLASDFSKDIVTLHGIGCYAGKKCYAVLNWPAAWDFFSERGMVRDGEVLVKARVKKYEATQLRFSPTIAAFLEQGGGSDILESVNLPNGCEFEREIFVLNDSTNYVQCYARNEDELNAAINNNSHVVVNLQNDITLSSIIKISSQKNVIINGCGHKIFEYYNPYTSSNVVGGRRVADSNGLIVQSPMGFNTVDGKMLTLEKSAVMKAVNWDSQNSLRIPAGITKDILDVFACYSLWYSRCREKINEWESDGTLRFCLSEKDKESELYIMGQGVYTPHPYFFLSNYDSGSTPEGVLVKNNKVKFPMQYSGVAVIKNDGIFTIDEGGKLEIHDLEMIGGKIYAVDNKGYLKLDNCKISNKIGGGILSTGRLFVNKCRFYDILSYAIKTEYKENISQYVEVTNCIFSRIGWYGSNVFAIESIIKGYIANNEFVDVNYGAIRVGNLNNGMTEEKRLANLNLVEYNTIRYTDQWKFLRKKLALQDGGAIYVATNNNRAIIRYNKILGAGGVDYNEYGMSRGIFCDDGAFNMSIYCNIIADTEWNTFEHFDIDSRDCPNPKREIPAGSFTNSNNQICYNLITGCLRMAEHCSTRREPITTSNNCRFEKNVIIRPFNRFGDVSELYPNKINSNYHPYTAHIPVIYDTNGYIDPEGNVHSAVDYISLFGCGHIGAHII